jgi:hypothetical protein
VSALRPEEGNEHGRFYPATASEPAVLLLTGAPRQFDRASPVPGDIGAFSRGHVLDARSLGMLERAGIPVSTGAR